MTREERKALADLIEAAAVTISASVAVHLSTHGSRATTMANLRAATWSFGELSKKFVDLDETDWPPGCSCQAAMGEGHKPGCFFHDDGGDDANNEG